MKDEFLVWLISGMSGSVAKDLLGLLTLRMKLANYHIVEIAADIFMKPPLIYRPEGWFIGSFADLLIGGMLGVVLGLFLRWTGTDHYMLKGTVLALFGWLILIGIVNHGLPVIFSIVLTDFYDLLNSIINHIVYGIVTVCLIVKLAPHSNSQA